MFVFSIHYSCVCGLIVVKSVLICEDYLCLLQTLFSVFNKKIVKLSLELCCLNVCYSLLKKRQKEIIAWVLNFSNSL